MHSFSKKRNALRLDETARECASLRSALDAAQADGARVVALERQLRDAQRELDAAHGELQTLTNERAESSKQEPIGTAAGALHGAHATNASTTTSSIIDELR